MKKALPRTVERRRNRAELRSAILFGTLVLAGCGEGLPPTVPVSGQVSWQGKPLGSGRIVFYPQEIAEGLSRRPAIAELDRQGRFQLSTFRTGDGVVPGAYHVCVFSYTSDQTTAEDDVSIPETIWRIPARYGDPQQSGLTAEIPSGSEPLSLNFELSE